MSNYDLDSNDENHSDANGENHSNSDDGICENGDLGNNSVCYISYYFKLYIL